MWRCDLEEKHYGCCRGEGAMVTEKDERIREGEGDRGRESGTHTGNIQREHFHQATGLENKG